MGWGSNPQFVHNCVRDYQSAKDFLERRYNKKYGEANISTVNPSRSNYAIYSRGDTICFRMYRTDIIRWCPDGRVILQEYDTGVTRAVQSHFGPIRIWKDSRINFRTKTRFGDWNGTHYPFEGTMEIEADGTVRGLQDEVRRVIPGMRAERSKVRRDFLQYAVPRVLLGEFGDLFSSAVGNQFTAVVPRGNHDKAELLHLFTNNAEHDSIVRRMQDTEYITKSCFGRKKWRANLYDTRDLASYAALESILRNELKDTGYRDAYHEWHKVNYEPINIHPERFCQP